MLDHVSITVSDFAAAERFYDAIMKALEIVKVGFEQFVASAAREHGLFYGLGTALMALLTGWFASVVFRKD